MNMANYIHFAKIVEEVRYRKEMNIPPDFDRGEIQNKTKSQFSLTKDMDKLEAKMEISKVFEIPDDIKKMLLLTDPPKDPDLLRLPFPIIFLDISISKGEAELDETTDIIRGIIIEERKVKSKTGDDYGRIFSVAYRTDETFEGKQYHALDETLFNVDSKNIRFKYSLRPKISKSLQKFIFNFVLFLNQPEVRLVEEVHRTKELMEKRRLR